MPNFYRLSTRTRDLLGAFWIMHLFILIQIVRVGFQLQSTTIKISIEKIFDYIKLSFIIKYILYKTTIRVQKNQHTIISTQFCKGITIILPVID